MLARGARDSRHVPVSMVPAPALIHAASAATRPRLLPDVSCTYAAVCAAGEFWNHSTLRRFVNGCCCCVMQRPAFLFQKAINFIMQYAIANLTKSVSSGNRSLRMKCNAGAGAAQQNVARIVFRLCHLQASDQ